VTTINYHCAQRSSRLINVIKLDLQGYDYRALCGARSTFSEVSVVLVEVLINERCEANGRLSDVLHQMEQCGLGMIPLSVLHHGAGDRLLLADAILVNEPFGCRKKLRLEASRQDERLG